MKQADPGQAASAVLMIRPAGFGFNAETAATNAFQRSPLALDPEPIQHRALRELERFAAKLRSLGVYVAVFDDTPTPVKPDSVFPNNWVSFHDGGTVVLYPMMAQNRRAEVRSEIIDGLRDQHGFVVRRIIDLRDPGTGAGGVLEGTGSLVLDRVNRIAYACRSARTDEAALRAFGARLDYETVSFSARCSRNLPVYHTNVMVTLGERFAVTCLDAITDEGERERVRRRLSSTGHEIVEISIEQMDRFAGNMLQLTNERGESLLAASEQAYDALTSAQRRALESCCDFVVAPLPTIEHYGGGSARCMLAEIFLERRALPGTRLDDPT